MFDTLVILGPTASGKSALSLAVAKLYDSEIISLDSALIYKGMDIGTAKPSKDELNICPHHLIDICDPADVYSAANFREDCINKVNEIRQRNRLPIICGGTMMYYKALVDGLSPVPKTDAQTREKVSKLGLELGWPKLHEMLKKHDPETAVKLSPNDKQRISRALEVFYMTGKPMSSFFQKEQDKCPFSRLEIVLLPKDNDRTELRKQIRTRFLKMIDDGFIDEVKKLNERKDFNPDLPSMRSVGYRQVLMYLNNELTYDEMIEQSVIATARLAKHQMTWLRGGLSNSDSSHQSLIESIDNSKRYYLEIEDPDKLLKLLTLMPHEWQDYLKHKP